MASCQDFLQNTLSLSMPKTCFMRYSNIVVASETAPAKMYGKTLLMSEAAGAEVQLVCVSGTLRGLTHVCHSTAHGVI